MKILLIVDDYLPHSSKVAAKMMHEMAMEFKRSGHDVSVLTPRNNQDKRLENVQLDGINVLYFKNGAVKNVNKVLRAINESLLSFNAWRACKKTFRSAQYDLIVSYSPSIFFGPLIKKLKRIWRCPSYLILRDIFPQWAVDNGLMKKDSIIYKYFLRFERINFSAATVIGAMSPSNLNFLNKSHPGVNKFEVLYNWAKTPSIPQKSIKFRKEYNLEDKVIFFYGGNIGHAQKMQNLIDLAIACKNLSEAHFLFIGEGDEVDLLLKQKELHKLDNLSYFSAVNQDEYLEILSEIDVGLFSLHPAHTTHNFPGKLLGYMGYGKPIIGFVNPGNDLKPVINNAKAGVIAEIKELNTIVTAVDDFVKKSELRVLYGNNGRQLLSYKFSVESACEQVLQSVSK